MQSIRVTTVLAVLASFALAEAGEAGGVLGEAERLPGAVIGEAERLPGAVIGEAERLPGAVIGEAENLVGLGAPKPKNWWDLFNKTAEKKSDVVVDDALSDHVDAAMDKEDAAALKSDDEESSLDKSLEKVKKNEVNLNDPLVKAAASDTLLPELVVASNATLLRAAAEVQRAKADVEVAKTNEDVSQKLLDESKFEAAQAEVKEARAEATEKSDAVEIAVNKEEKKELSKTEVEKVVANEELPKAEMLKAEVDKIETEIAAGLITETAAELEEKRLQTEAADVKPFPSLFVMAGCAAPPVLIMGLFVQYRDRRRQQMQPFLDGYDQGHDLETYNHGVFGSTQGYTVMS